MTLQMLTATTALYSGDCREAMRLLPADSLDSCLCDPPYNIKSIAKRFGAVDATEAQHGRDGAYARLSRKFIGIKWDDDVALRPETWAEVLRVLKPGAHLAAFGFAKSGHRLACAIEDAGFEIRESLAWLYGTGQVRRREQLKAAFDPIIIGRKSLTAPTLGEHVAQWGVGALQIDACRGDDNRWPTTVLHDGIADKPFFYHPKASAADRVMRCYEQVRVEWNSEHGPCQALLLVDTEPSPPRVIDASGSVAVHEWSTFLFGSTLKDQFPRECKFITSTKTNSTIESITWNYLTRSLISESTADAICATDSGSSPVESAPSSVQSVTITGEATVYLHGANPVAFKMPLKLSVLGKKEGHPSVKPISLLRWLARLITPPGGSVLDPFAGSGTTGAACALEGFNCVMCEREAEYVADIVARFASPPLAPK